MPTFLPRRVLPGSVYEITDRTAHGHHWLCQELRLQIEEVLARAACIGRVTLHAYVFMGNHYHLLLSCPGVRDLGRFLQVLNAGVARLVNGHHRRSGKVWQRRADVVPVSDEPEAQLWRLAYIMANGVKEGLVIHPLLWSGPHFARAFRESVSPASENLRCHSSNLSKGYTRTMDVRAIEVPAVAPLPHLASMTPERLRRAMLRLADRVSAHPKDRDGWLEPHLLDPDLPLAAGVASKALVRSPDPDEAPELKFDARDHKRPTPRDKPRPRHPVHAFDAAVRKEIYRDLEAFHQAYAEASAMYRSGASQPRFPSHCVLPPVAFHIPLEMARAA